MCIGKICSILILISISFINVACARTNVRQTSNDKVEIYKAIVQETLPHQKNAYTQGLFFHNGQLYESTGQYGESTFRKVDLKTGNVLRRLDFDNRYFVEGSCVLDNRLYILTWKEKKCFVYDINTLKYLGELYNPREGWGLTTDGKDLILSDGTDKLYFLNPMNFAVKKVLDVKVYNKPLNYLNELEYIDGKIWANVYGADELVIINPDNGIVESIIDCTNILSPRLKTTTTDVLNGIAYNPVDKSIYITGKYWPKMFKIILEKL